MYQPQSLCVCSHMIKNYTGDKIHLETQTNNGRNFSPFLSHFFSYLNQTTNLFFNGTVQTVPSEKQMGEEAGQGQE